ncbi:hypothetical protein [Lentilactobacillus sp. Marseille-Q4993]|uniref:hypothetical protein n=1 Tax=Lentilactobacillus sp. Marseille-Q4993 TaxID=3039492 RepID=UPI0024BC36F2|nr:hypothetical protein [Lentilactobacillus sp. Marseille-Q4993]
MIKKSARDALGFIIIGIIFDVFLIPFELIMHRPILNGMVPIFESISRKPVVAFAIAETTAFCWLLLFMVILFFRWLNAALRKQDIKK